MNIIRPLTLLAALGSAISALACDVPDASINIPRGDEATRDEMVAAQSRVRDLQAATDEYLACLDGELEALGEDATEEQRNLLVEQHNNGVDRLEEVAAEFNEQLGEFNAKAAAEN